MNCTNCSWFKNQTTESSPNSPSIAVMICLLLILGLLLNVFSMWVFRYRILEWKSGTVLQFNLVISDLILCPLAPFLTYYFAIGYWPFGSVMCWINTIVLTAHFYGSIFFLTLISIHRYVSVVYHSQESRMKQTGFVKKLCIGVWTVVLIKGVVFCLVQYRDTMDNNDLLCFNIHWSTHPDVYFYISLWQLSVGFLIPFVISLVCYSRLARSVSGINISHMNGKRMKRKSLKMVAVCLLIFGLCFMPMNVSYAVLMTANKFNERLCPKIEEWYRVSWILSSANCCLDPLIYCFSSQNFTAAFRRSLRIIGVRLRTTRQGMEHESALTTHVSPTPRTIKRQTMSITQL